MPPRQDLIPANQKSIDWWQLSVLDSTFRLLGTAHQLALAKISQAAEFLGGQAGFARSRLDEALRHCVSNCPFRAVSARGMLHISGFCCWILKCVEMHWVSTLVVQVLSLGLPTWISVIGNFCNLFVRGEKLRGIPLHGTSSSRESTRGTNRFGRSPAHNFFSDWFTAKFWTVRVWCWDMLNFWFYSYSIDGIECSHGVHHVTSPSYQWRIGDTFCWGTHLNVAFGGMALATLGVVGVPDPHFSIFFCAQPVKFDFLLYLLYLLLDLKVC